MSAPDSLGDFLSRRDAIPETDDLIAGLNRTREADAAATGPAIYKGHDWSLGGEGADVLLTVWPSGSMEVATRPGRDRTSLRWGPPVTLEVAP